MRARRARAQAVGRRRPRRAWRPRHSPDPGRARPHAPASTRARPRGGHRGARAPALSLSDHSAARRAHAGAAQADARHRRSGDSPDDPVHLGGLLTMNPQLTTRLRHLRLSGMVEALPGSRRPSRGRAVAASRVSRAARRGRARPTRRSALRAPAETGRHHHDEDARRFRLELQSEDPEDEDRRIGQRALRRHAQRRAADRPTRRRQIAHRHRDRHRRDSRRPPRARAQHLRSRGRLRRGGSHRRATRSGPAAHARRPARPRRLRDEEARPRMRPRTSSRSLCGVTKRRRR